jgi:hypothetical protein
MNETSENKRKSRLRWVTLGEAIAISALILSGIGLWHEWNKRESAPVVVEKPTAIPLALRGEVTKEGRELEISPLEDGHALQSLTVSLGATSIELNGDGELDANDVEQALGEAAKDAEGPHRVPVRIAARYIEAGTDKTATGSYVIRYRMKDRLIGGPSLRFEGFSR